MADRSNAPVIIKRKKVVGGDGHHGGAWKVAYADFVTAMMAFFLLMWLLNATTEQQRKGIADYFSPTIPVNRISGGGEGMFGGDDVLSDQTLPEVGQGQTAEVPLLGDADGGVENAAEVAALQDIFARENAPLFVNQGTQPAPVLVELTNMFARVFGLVTNPVAVEGHTQSLPVVAVDRPVWDISTGRAETVRHLLEGGGLDPQRIARMTGHADRDHAHEDALSVRNNRIEITLLRTANNRN